MPNSAYFAEDRGANEMLAAEPVPRFLILLGRLTGLAGAIVAVGTLAFGAAGVLIAVRSGLAGAGGYALVGLGATALGLVGLGAGALVGLRAWGRAGATAWALALWIGGVLVYDLAAIVVLQVVGTGQPGPWLVALLAANPIDGVRSLALGGLGADVLLGPTGAALKAMLGPAGGAAWVLVSLAGWLLLPVVAAGWIFQRKDFG